MSDKISESKLEEVINAGLSVFVKDTYKKASVNDIVSLTKISKGSFYNYFKSKYDFYIYLYEYCIKTVITEYNKVVGQKSSDLFERVKQTTNLKLVYLKKYPLVNEFILKALFEKDEQIRAYIEKRKTDLNMDSELELLDGIDESKFKEDIDPETIYHMLVLLSEGIAKESGYTNESIEDAFKEFSDYVEIIKKASYK